MMLSLVYLRAGKCPYLDRSSVKKGLVQLQSVCNGQLVAELNVSEADERIRMLSLCGCEMEGKDRKSVV